MSNPSINAPLMGEPVDLKSVMERHPDVFKGNLLKRFRPVFVAVAVALYFVFAWTFFNVSYVLNNGKWDIVGSYLADWVSYEVRPDIEYRENYLDVEFPRFSPLGKNPQVSWIEETKSDVKIVTKAQETSSDTNAAGKSAGFSFMNPQATPDTKPKPAQPATGFSFMVPEAKGTSMSGSATKDSNAEQSQAVTFEEKTTSAVATIGEGKVTISKGKDGWLVTLQKGDEAFDIAIQREESVKPLGDIPSWARQKYENGKIVANYDFAGRIEVENDEVKIRRRFLGWENFVFDTNSPFWGKSFGEVWSMVTSGEQIKQGTSNLALAYDNILNNAEWQHGDVWLKLLQTIVMAFVGTLLATLLAFPLAFFAARNITPSSIANQVVKRMFDFLRSVDMLIWALFFTRAFGPGPLAGMSAIFFTDTGTLGKLYSEALENIDDKQREGVKSLGANPILVQRYGVLPQVLPVFLSQSLYFWESNTRSATIIGAVGAGGIGLKLWEAMRTNQDWENVFYMVLLILAVVYIFDTISGKLRSLLVKQ